MAVSASLRALLEQGIDYAGMFPPCSLALEPGLRNQANYVRSHEEWMLNGFVLPIEQFDMARQFVLEFDRQHPLHIAALGAKTTKADTFLDALEDGLAAIRSFARYDLNLVVIGHLEMLLPDDIDAASLKKAKSITGDLPAFWEAPPERAKETIALITEYNSDQNVATFGYKLRTGGVTANAFPTSAQIANALVTSATQHVPIKFTAGLHHPIRQFRDEVKAKMHGFLNVLGAAVLCALHNWDEKQTAAMLEDENPKSFSFSDPEFTWCDGKADVDSIIAQRKRVFSFGSCSF